MSMFLDLNEANEKLTKLGFIIVRFPRGSLKKSMVVRKTGKNSWEEIQVSDTFIEKVKANTLILNDTVNILPTLNMQVLSDYDSRQEIIDSHKALQKKIRKEAKKFLNVRKAIIARGTKANSYYIIDIESNEAKPIDKSLIDDIEEVHYTKEQVSTCLRDNLINLHQKAYTHELNKWDSVKVAK